MNLADNFLITPEHLRVPVNDKTRELAKKYPIEAAYNSRASLWGCALRDGLVTEEFYNIAMNYYGRLWDYCGD